MRNGADESALPHSIAELFLRAAVIPLCAASLWLMAVNKQTSGGYGKVEFSNLPGLWYLVCINGVSLGYAVLAILLTCLGQFHKGWFFYALDQVVSYLMVTSGSAVAEVLYLAREGERKASWSEACSYYGRFCEKMKVSLALHLAALACFVALSVGSSYRVFRKFEAPSISAKNVEEEEATEQI